MAEGLQDEQIAEEQGSEPVPEHSPAPEPTAKIVELEKLPPKEPDAETVTTENVDVARADSKGKALPGSNGGSRRTTPQGNGHAAASNGTKLPNISGLPSQQNSKKTPLKVGHGPKTDRDTLPSIGPKAGLPKAYSASPMKRRNFSPGRGRNPGRASADGAGQESLDPDIPNRSLSPGGGNWNLYNKTLAKPKKEILVSGPSDEERAKRREWATAKRRREEAARKLVEERDAALRTNSREEEESRLEARRVGIRERIARQHEIAVKMAGEKQLADERARQELHKFRGQKPLHERMNEEYEANKEKEEHEAKAKYDAEIAAMRNVRPHQIITGEVVVKPAIVKDSSPSKERTAASGRSPARRLVQGKHDLAVYGDTPSSVGGKTQGVGEKLRAAGPTDLVRGVTHRAHQQSDKGKRPFDDAPPSDGWRRVDKRQKGRPPTNEPPKRGPSKKSRPDSGYGPKLSWVVHPVTGEQLTMVEFYRLRSLGACWNYLEPGYLQSACPQPPEQDKDKNPKEFAK